jgi:predicted DNA-binding transcriptional regulator
MLAIHRRVVVAEAMRVRVCRSELTFSHFTTRFHVSSLARRAKLPW